MMIRNRFYGMVDRKKFDSLPPGNIRCSHRSPLKHCASCCRTYAEIELWIHSHCTKNEVFHEGFLQ